MLAEARGGHVEKGAVETMEDLTVEPISKALSSRRPALYFARKMGLGVDVIAEGKGIDPRQALFPGIRIGSCGCKAEGAGSALSESVAATYTSAVNAVQCFAGQVVMMVDGLAYVDTESGGPRIPIPYFDEPVANRDGVELPISVLNFFATQLVEALADPSLGIADRLVVTDYSSAPEDLRSAWRCAVGCIVW